MICLDSDCIIDFLRNKEEAVGVIQAYHEQLVTTEINVFEVFLGIYLKQHKKENEEEIAENFFSNFDIVAFREGCGKASALILTGLAKTGKTIEQNDAYVASIMASCGCRKIITRNRKHFSAIKGVEVISY